MIAVNEAAEKTVFASMITAPLALAYQKLIAQMLDVSMGPVSLVGRAVVPVLRLKPVSLTLGSVRRLLVHVPKPVNLAPYKSSLIRRITMVQFVT